MRQKSILIYRPNDRMVTEENGTSNYLDEPRLPYSLSVVAAFLRNNNYFVQAYDALASNDDVEKAKNKLLKYKPEILIIPTNIVACDLSLGGIEEIKRKTGCKVISLINLDFAEEILTRFQFLDFVIRYEWAGATKGLLDFLHGKISKIEEVKGIFYRDKGNKIVNTPPKEHLNINQRPLPAFDLFPMKDYLTYTIETSLGCPHHCIFCPFGHYPKTGWEGKDIDKVILEIKEMFRYGKKLILFLDNETTADSTWCKGLLQGIIEEKLDIEGDTNIRASSIDEEMVALLVKAGITRVGIGAESGVQEILNKNLKELTLEQIKNAFFLLKKYGIVANVYFLMGLLGDTKETIKETYRFITQELKAYQASFDIVIPYPGTPMYRLLKQKGWIEKLTIDNLIWIYKNLYHYPNLKNFEGEKPNWRLDNLTFDDLLELFFEYYPKVYKSPTRSLAMTNIKRGKIFQKATRMIIKNPKKFFQLTKDLFFPKKTKF